MTFNELYMWALTVFGAAIAVSATILGGLFLIWYVVRVIVLAIYYKRNPEFGKWTDAFRKSLPWEDY